MPKTLKVKVKSFARFTYLSEKYFIGSKYLISRIVQNTFLGWQIIRTSESTSEEFVMIYDLWIEQAEEDEECEDGAKKHSETNHDNEQRKGSQDVIEE